MDAGQIKATVVVEDKTKEGLKQVEKSLNDAASKIESKGVAIGVDAAKTKKNIEQAAKTVSAGTTIDLSPKVETKGAKAGAQTMAKDLQAEATKATTAMNEAFKATVQYISQLLKSVNGASTQVDANAIGRYRRASQGFIDNASQSDRADSLEGLQYSRQLFGETSKSLNNAGTNSNIEATALRDAQAAAQALTAEAEERLGVESDEVRMLKDLNAQIDEALATNKANRAEIESAKKALQEQSKAVNKAARANNLDGSQNGKKGAKTGNSADVKKLKEMKSQYQQITASMAVMRSEGKANTEEYAKLEEQAKALKATITGTGKANNEALDEKKPQTFTSQLRKVRDEMTRLQMEGKAASSEYSELAAKATELRQSMVAVNTESSGTTEAETNLEGMASAMGGVAAAGSVMAGTYALCGEESENMQKVMVKLQAVMSITNGLQTIAATLNKSSAAAIWLRNVATAASTTATTAETVAENANTAATTANTAARTANATAGAGAATSTAANTAATAANTAAAAAGTTANIGLAGAFKMVGAAIKSIPVFGWIAAGIAALVAAYSALTTESRKARKEQAELDKAIAEGSAGNISKLETLRSLWSAETTDEGKRGFLVRYREQLAALGVELENVAEANEYFRSGLESTVASTKAGAAADAWSKRSEEAAKTLAEKQSEYDAAVAELTKAEKDYETKRAAYNKAVMENSPFIISTANEAALSSASTLHSRQSDLEDAKAELDKAQAEYERITEQSTAAKKAAAKTQDADTANAENKARAKERAEDMAKLEAETVAAETAAMRDGYAKQRTELKNQLDAQLKEIEKARAEMAGKNGGSLDEAMNAQYDRQAQAARRSYTASLNELNRAEQDEVRRSGEETLKIERENIAARLALMVDGTAKEKAQIEQSYNDRMAEIQREREEYQREMASQGKGTDAIRMNAYTEAETIAGEERKAKLLELEEKTNEEVEKLRKENRDAAIGGMTEGYAKELATIKAAYEDRERELAKMEEQWRKGDNGDGTLSEAHASYLATARRSNSTQRSQAENELIMSDYERLQQKKIALTNDYNAKRIVIEREADATIKANRLAALDESYKQSMRDIEGEELDSVIANSKTLMAIFNNVGKRSKAATKQAQKQLNQLLQRSRDNTTQVTGMTNEEADNLLSNSESIKRIWEEINEIQEENANGGGFVGSLQVMGKSLSNLIKTSKALKVATNEIDRGNLIAQKEAAMESFVGATVAACQGVAELATALSSLAGEDTETAQNLQNVSTVISDIASYAGMGASVGGGWGALAGGVVGAISGMVKIWDSSKARARENAAALKEYTHQLELMGLELDEDKYDTIFGTKSAQKAADAYELAGKALNKMGDKVAEYYEGKASGERRTAQGSGALIGTVDYEAAQAFIELHNARAEAYDDQAASIRANLEEADTLKALKEAAEGATSGLKDINAVQTSKRHWYKIGSKNKYNTLEQYDVWDEAGNLDTEKAQKFLDTQTNITSECREQLEYAIEMQNAYEEAVNSIDGYLSDIFGSWGSDLTDAIYDSIYNGADAWYEFKNIGNEAIADLGKSMAQELVMQTYLDQYQARLREAVAAGDNGMSLQNLMSEMIGGMGTVYTQMSDFAQMWEDAANANGYDVAKVYSDTNNKTLSGAISTASQESIDLLAGQTNAVRVQQIEGINVMRQQLEQLAEINTSTLATANAATVLIGITTGIYAKSGATSNELRAVGKTSY